MLQGSVPRANEPGFVAFPPPPGQPPYRMALASLEIPDPSDSLTFHCIGDSGGIVDAGPQKAVCAALAADLSGASFLYHVGDLVYFNGDASQYFPQFYEPNEAYAAPIVGIPGNHDGDNSDAPNVASLTAFYGNMCAPSPVLTPQAGDVDRDAMTQPGPYFTLTANLVTIIGLYTNVPSGGAVAASQQAWFLEEVKAAPTDRALIVSLHHPPYSCDAFHGGSATMGALLDETFAAAGRKPDLVLSGHVHDYQRFTRSDGVTYIVNGGGGYHNLHKMASGIGPLPWTVPGSDVTLEAYADALWGFLRLTVTPTGIQGVYTAVGPTAAPAVADSFTVTRA